jgi:hypothetical protein
MEGVQSKSKMKGVPAYNFVRTSSQQLRSKLVTACTCCSSGGCKIFILGVHTVEERL